VEQRDVVIIGGGPAGATAGTLLARKGHKVTLLEKETFPRDHVGESLLPFCYSLFETLGVREEMERRFVRKPGVRFVDRDGVLRTTWCFDHIIKDPSYLAFQVIRSEFDQILLDNARRNGVDVREGTCASEATLGDEEPHVSVRALGPNGSRVRLNARFLIDASGRDTFLGSRVGARAKNPDLDRTALWSHWTGATLVHGLEEGLSLIIYLGEQKKGWLWVFPLGSERVTIGVVLENSYIRAERAKERRDWALDLYLREILSSDVVTQVLAGATLSRPVTVNGDYSYSVARKYGHRFALIGDAHRFIDPIFSSGIFLSMKSALIVTDAIDAVLRSADSNPAPLEAAYETINGAYEFVHKLIKLFYNPHALTWAELGAREELHKRHEAAMAAGHYILAGDFFERHQRYVEFLDLLQNPRHFQKYQVNVIDRAEFRVESCRARRTDVFPPTLVEHERRREAEDEALRSQSAGQEWTAVRGSSRPR
jgi:flavin-dependent dehydrogenase